MDIGRFEDVPPGNRIIVKFVLRLDLEFVAGFELIEISEQFTVDVVMCRQYHIAAIRRCGTVLHLSDAQLQRFPVHPLNQKEHRLQN